MPSELPRIDHLVINVADRLDQALEQYRRLGFALTARGHHTLGSSNHLAIFGTDYIELIGYEPQNAEHAAKRWGPLPGLSGLVFKSGDADRLFSELSDRGVTLLGDQPQAFSRPVELPDGSLRDARFRTVHLDPAALPRVYFCQHLDPDLVWRSEWQSHPNGVQSIVQAVIEARDPAASIKVHERLFGAAATREIDGGYRLTAGDAHIDYLCREAVRARFGETTASRPNDTDHRPVAITFRTAALDQTRSALQAGGIEFKDGGSGLLLVASDQAFDVALAFTE